MRTWRVAYRLVEYLGLMIDLRKGFWRKMEKDNEVVKYDEYDVRFMDRMVQRLLGFLPDDYRKTVEIESYPMEMKVFGTDHDGETFDMVPFSVKVKSPDDGGWVKFDFTIGTVDLPDYDFAGLLGGHVDDSFTGTHKETAYKVSAVTDKGDERDISVDEGYFDNKDDDSRALGHFIVEAKGIIEDRFGVMDGVRSVYPSTIESVGVANRTLMMGVKESMPKGWNVRFSQSILNDYGVPFVDSVTFVHSDTEYPCPVHVSAISNDVLHVMFHDEDYSFNISLVLLPSVMKNFIWGETRPVVVRVIEHLENMKKTREDNAEE